MASVLFGTALIRLRLRRPPEGWRRTVGILLRSEFSRFALSSFGLQLPRGVGDNTVEVVIAGALQAFLAQEPDAHFSLEWRTPVTLRRHREVADLVVQQFARDGALTAIAPVLAASQSPLPSEETRARVHRAIVDAYNRTSQLIEVQRPRALLREALAGIGTGSPAAHRYVRRLLSAGCLSFETIDLSDPERRFGPPAFAARRTLGFGPLAWVARPSPQRGTVDLWVSAHHVGLDGVPLQDLLNRLERAWGTAERVTFPDAQPGHPFIAPHACHIRGERDVDQLIDFVDLSPVLALRRELNARHGDAAGGGITLGAVIAWLLAHEPEFAGVRIASTVDVAASQGYERDVDVVSLRPADFATGEGPWGGFIAFAREFNRLIAAARERTSPVRIGMQTSGLIPAWAHAASVHANPAALDDTFGTLCITIVRDARVFVAPMTDLGLRHGFFAIGSATLPSRTGGTVGSICVKGEAGRIADYPSILQRAIDRCASVRPDVVS